MDESDHPNNQSLEPPTPEVAQLLRMLEVQREALRGRHPERGPKGLQGGSGLQGVSFRWGSIAVIVIFALGSIGVMEWIVSQLPKPPARNAVVAPGQPTGDVVAGSGAK